MPRTRKMEAYELESFTVTRNLKKPLEDVKKAVTSGAKLEMVESLFNDPGPDYCKVLLDGEEIAHIPGYLVIDRKLWKYLPPEVQLKLTQADMTAAEEANKKLKEGKLAYDSESGEMVEIHYSVAVIRRGIN